MIRSSSSFLIGQIKLLGLGKRRTGKLDFSKANTFKNGLIMIVWMVSVTRFVLFFLKEVALNARPKTFLLCLCNISGSSC